jgi:hypothetical protein
MNGRRRFGVAGTFVLVAIGMLLPGTRADAAEWEWTITPYLFASDIGMDLTANDEPVLGAVITFQDLLDKRELAAMVHFEGRRGKVGFLVDALYLSVSSGRTTTGHPIVPDGTTVDSDIETGIYEAGGFYRMLGEGRAFDLLLGARLIPLQQETHVAFPSPTPIKTTISGSDDVLDGFVGLRYGQPLGGRWDFVIRGDVGAGDSDLAWNAFGALGLRCGKTGKYTLRFGWRQLVVESESESTIGVDIENELTFSGPVVGFAIKL